jgi:hypothetical protein
LPALQAPIEHGDGGTKTPPKLGVIYLLLNPHLPLTLKLVPKPEECVLEGEIEAILWSIFELEDGFFVMAPVFFPCRPSGTDTLSGGRDVRDCELVFGGHERMEAIVKVG